MQALERVHRTLASDVPVTAAVPASQRRLALSIGRRMQMVELDELDCALAQANYVELKVGTRSFILRDTISGFHARLVSGRSYRDTLRAALGLAAESSARTHATGTAARRRGMAQRHRQGVPDERTEDTCDHGTGCGIPGTAIRRAP